MIRITDKAKLREIVTGTLLGLLVAIVTFPAPDWSYGPGIDPPLAWVFNSLFLNGSGSDPVIIFPHGPLAFFTYPTAENAWLVMIVTIFLKIMLILSIKQFITAGKTWTKWLAASAVTYLVSVSGGFSHLLLANIMAGYAAGFHQGFSKWTARYFLVLLLTAIAFYVKAYTAIIAGILFISSGIYHLIKTKKVLPFLTDSFILLIIILLFWLFLFRSFHGFITYVNGMVHLAQDNSSAAAYYPYNNWLVLSSFILLIIIIIIVNRNKESLFFSSLMGLSLFAAWKHGMAREDIYHVMGFFVFVMMSLALFILFSGKRLIINILIATAALFLLSLNSKNAMNYSPRKYEWFSAGNFFSFISDHKTLKDDAQTATSRAIAINILPDYLLEFINDYTTDVYPWDYSIIPANNLNWQHRPVIHPYASYTPWLDRQNAGHFSSAMAPDYIVWEKDKITSDVNGGKFNSIDGRYLLNDEPQTLLELINRYDFVAEEGKFILLGKRETSLQPVIHTISTVQGHFREWFPVPDTRGDILRVKLNFKKTFLQRLKSFLYKDEQFWIYLKLTNGEIHKYRIVPANANVGIWIKPYLFNYDKEFEVDEIMFVASNPGILTENLSLEWEMIDFDDDGNRAVSFFNIDDDREDSLIFVTLNGFEEDKIAGWSSVKEELKCKDEFSGEISVQVNAESFSPGFAMNLDSIPFGDLRFATDARLSAPGYKFKNKILPVISVETEKGTILWQSIPADLQLIDEKGWNHIYNQALYYHSTPGCTLKIYFWNQSDIPLLLDDFRVMVFLPATS